jgi:putative colanic acid biosynthesis UDP-glucose lipid carrier transferase
MIIDFYIRALDILIAILAILALSPVLIGVAAMVGLTGRPIVFRQKRNGQKGKTFTIYKFRTMKVMENGDSLFKQASVKDNRITTVGNFLRHYSLDELPQLFNVLKGEMSIVGTRPHPLALDREFEDQVPNYMERYTLRPGLTGLAQVREFRGPTDTLEKMVNRVNSDLEYIEKRSAKLYFKIIRETAVAMFRIK